MKRWLSDTHPKMERKHIEVLRGLGPERRGWAASTLTNQSRWRARQAIAQANPHLAHEDRELLLIESLYGRELAERVREALLRRRRR